MSKEIDYKALYETEVREHQALRRRFDEVSKIARSIVQSVGSMKQAMADIQEVMDGIAEADGKKPQEPDEPGDAHIT